jgi:hypothetical protein
LESLPVYCIVIEILETISINLCTLANNGQLPRRVICYILTKLPARAAMELAVIFARHVEMQIMSGERLLNPMGVGDGHIVQPVMAQGMYRFRQQITLENIFPIKSCSLSYNKTAY